VPDELRVDISREELHALEVPAAFETDDAFDVRFRNHGESVHVHLHLDDRLSRAATVDASNHYVEGQSQRTVRVRVDPEALSEEPLRGKLKVVSAYGAETRWVDVELAATDESTGTVEVDESLSKPQPRADPADTGPSLPGPELPVIALGAVAVVVAVVAAAVLREMIVLIGSLVVLAGVIVALVILLGE
jgi:hypothetical protein